MNGAKRPELQQLPQIKQRMTFLYLDHCQISRKDSAVKIRNKDGIYLMPVAQISVLILGPGTTITHDGVLLIGDAGVSLIWAGEYGVRFYAAGSSLTHNSVLLERQAKNFSNQREHLKIAKKMYQKRFDDDVSKMTMNQLRSIEGNRMKQIYKDNAAKFQVKWSGRRIHLNHFEECDAVNQALTAGNMCLYGLAHAVISALGMAPGLGFVHVGHDKSFVYDIADLYKAEYTIPLAFKLASLNTPEIASVMRRKMRDLFFEKKILKQMVKDIQDLFYVEGEEDFRDDLFLWNGIEEAVSAGIMYGASEYQ